MFNLSLHLQTNLAAPEARPNWFAGELNYKGFPIRQAVFEKSPPANHPD
jgi:hypothetical protein